MSLEGGFCSGFAAKISIFFGLNVGSVGTSLLTPRPIGGPRFV